MLGVFPAVLIPAVGQNLSKPWLSRIQAVESGKRARPLALPTVALAG